MSPADFCAAVIFLLINPSCLYFAPVTPSNTTLITFNNMQVREHRRLLAEQDP